MHGPPRPCESPRQAAIAIAISLSIAIAIAIAIPFQPLCAATVGGNPTSPFAPLAINGGGQGGKGFAGSSRLEEKACSALLPRQSASAIGRHCKAAGRPMPTHTGGNRRVPRQDARLRGVVTRGSVRLDLAQSGAVQRRIAPGPTAAWMPCRHGRRCARGERSVKPRSSAAVAAGWSFGVAARPAGPLAHASGHFSVVSNNSSIRRYSSYQLSGRVKPCRSSGYEASSHLSLRSSMSFCASITESL